MDTKVNYFAVGLFVILLTVAIMYASMWLITDKSHKSYTYYSVYMEESVSGLNKDAPVKYQGVKVGFVDTIRLETDRPHQVHLILKVESYVPISKGTTAKMIGQGLTGIRHIELSTTDNNKPRLMTPEGEDYPVIASAPSLSSKVESVLGTLMKDLDKVSDSLEKVLSPKNAEALTQALENIEVVTKTFRKHNDKLENIIGKTDKLVSNIGQSSDSIPKLIDNASKAMEDIKASFADIKDASHAVKETASNSHVFLQSLDSQVMPETVATMSKIHDLANTLQQFVEQLRDNPDLVLKGRTNVHRGPGE